MDLLVYLRVLVATLLLLTFMGEALRNAFDTRKAGLMGGGRS